ncbi:MAG: D-glycero-beta-D-manno-heptose 1,7-bisphosphate 7-phosphatase [Lautropia sp.]
MPLILLDRDGVILRNVEGYLNRPDAVEFLPGSLDALARLAHAGYQVAIVTNQAALSRGVLEMSTVNAIHQRMVRQVEAAGGRIDAIAICPHGPEQRCNCRKPQPGLLNEVLERFNAGAADTPMVGDSLHDIEAGIAAGTRTWLVRSGNGETTLAAGRLADGVQVADDLADVVTRLLAPAATS